MIFLSEAKTQTRMAHIRPAELLLPTKGLSKASEKLLRYFTEFVAFDL